MGRPRDSALGRLEEVPGSVRVSESRDPSGSPGAVRGCGDQRRGQGHGRARLSPPSGSPPLTAERPECLSVSEVTVFFP